MDFALPERHDDITDYMCIKCRPIHWPLFVLYIPPRYNKRLMYWSIKMIPNKMALWEFCIFHTPHRLKNIHTFLSMQLPN